MGKNSVYKPRTFGDVLGFVNKTVAACTGTLQADWKISVAVGERAINFLPLIQNDSAIMANALAAQTSKSRELKTSLKLLYWFVSDMHEELERNIRRGGYPINNGFKAEDRAYYGLPVSSDKLPRMVSSSEIVNTAKAFIDGEEKRIDDNKPALVATTLLMLKQRYDIYLQKESEYIPLKSSFKVAQKKMSIRCDEGFEIYDDVDADLRSTLRKETKEAFRSISFDWGLLFRESGYDPTIFSHVMAIINCDDIPVQNVTIEFVNLGLKFTTDNHGELSTFKVKAGLHQVKIYCEGYTTVEIPQFKVELNIDNVIKAELEMIIIFQ